MDEFDMFGSVGNGVSAEEDPAAAFLAQQESEIAGIENDEGFSILDSGELPVSLQTGDGATDTVMNGDFYQEANGPTDGYAAISHADRLRAEPESIRKWREEQRSRLEMLDANSKKQESEWKEKASKELEEWYTRQDELLQKAKANNRVADEAFYKQPFADMIGYVTNINHPCYSLEQAAEEAFVSDVEETSPGTEWERVARLCDFNPKSSKQAKDVSRMRSVLITLKQTPLVH
ncbi:clathrin light chain A S homeolog isoform X1 [Xenopus laevis]|uniref:Clathrin light chain n=1 Tax=Xenopus laevis TaxID=8355 RepID=A0A8J1LUJ5_XENLA|nr:clathrin light chain A S homeolog isoform X1 [Xenopus laevis]